MVKHLGSEGVSQEASLHPIHLFGPEGTLHPAALVPFCAYQSNLLGRDPGFNFTACDRFQPTVLDGQLCYSVKFDKESKTGKSQGLLMVLDPGMSREESASDGPVSVGKNTLNLEDLGEERSSVKIHLNTLTEFVTFQPGSYGLYVLKNIKASKGFLGLDEIERGCQTEHFETCEVREYFEKVKTRCSCTPWSLTGNMSEEVSTSKQFWSSGGYVHKLLSPKSF